LSTYASTSLKDTTKSARALSRCSFSLSPRFPKKSQYPLDFMKIPQQTIAATLAMTFSVFAQRAAAFTATRSSAFVPNKMTTRAASTFGRSLAMYAEKGQAEVILVGCGAPNRGMGWYHAVQMLEKE